MIVRRFRRGRRPEAPSGLAPDSANLANPEIDEANRTLPILKAALNLAWREKKIVSDDEWRRVEPFKEADAAQVRYLNLEECHRLINASHRGRRSNRLATTAADR